MFVRVARPLFRTTTRFTSTTASKRVTLSSHSINKKSEVNGDKALLVFRNNVMKGAMKSSRRVSTSPLLKGTKALGNPEPPSSAFLDVRILPPEVHSEPPIQVPYVPDFWESAKPIPDAPIMEVPKVVVVGGTETSHGSAHSHTLEDINVLLESDSTQLSQDTERSDSVLDDIAEDLHLPPIQEMKNSFRKIFS